jgi:hypothetical protein
MTIESRGTPSQLTDISGLSLGFVGMTVPTVELDPGICYLTATQHRAASLLNLTLVQLGLLEGQAIDFSRQKCKSYITQWSFFLLYKAKSYTYALQVTLCLPW